MYTGTICLLILLSTLDLILLNADTYYSINTPTPTHFLHLHVRVTCNLHATGTGFLVLRS